MKCKVCGAESGKYPLCRVCNIKKEKGEIIKCTICNNWHYTSQACNHNSETYATNEQDYLYELKSRLISKSEVEFYNALKQNIPEGYCIFPQINLASFVNRTDDARFHNELFRNVDFLITDSEYCPKIIVEINDNTHLTPERKERDEKVKNICEEAGIPIVKLWTTYGVNSQYIGNKISETLASLPVKRIHHPHPEKKSNTESEREVSPPPRVPVKIQSLISDSNDDYNRRGYKYSGGVFGGCYIATCVYGSYDCPNVWILRRFRDNVLAKSWYGKMFIRMYYSISPTIVKIFGKSKLFRRICLKPLDRIVESLRSKGYEDTPYNDLF